MEDRNKADGLAVEDARKRIAGNEEERSRVVDIRPFDEFAEGHIAGALHLDESGADEVEQGLGGEESERWILVCDDGARSAELAGELSGRGIEAAYLDGGMKAWIKENLPTQPPESDTEYEGPKNTTLY
ncbi:MAG: rhodanese-like domain-containing protein [Actinobacteria bacterium]|nr:rhodanese-like domain-containing protein [Actinomycetota bacterium]